jgi:plasmid stabilization system protein ParE
VSIRFTAVGRREYAAQLAHLAAVSRPAADRLASEFEQGLRLIDRGLAEGSEVEFRDGRRVRKWIVPPLVVFSERDGRDILVRRVRHGAQRPITRT